MLGFGLIVEIFRLDRDCSVNGLGGILDCEGFRRWFRSGKISELRRFPGLGVNKDKKGQQGCCRKVYSNFW